MNQLVIASPLKNDFFSPMDGSILDVLIKERNELLSKIEKTQTIVNSVASNEELSQAFLYLDISNITSLNLWRAKKKLDSEYWRKALEATDVYEYMTADHRNTWENHLTAWTQEGYIEGINLENDLIPFTEENVKSSLQHLLYSRSKFFAERVDGVFKNLSGEHVTNRPEGFSKRMILSNVYNDQSVNYVKSGYISDLRIVVAKFMGREPPKHLSTDPIINYAYVRHGEWISIDGGALRIRVYLKGTAHLEIHPEMAWRLNFILASLYPMAIPPVFRKKPEKIPKEFTLIKMPLPFEVVNYLNTFGRVPKMPTDERNRVWVNLSDNPFAREFEYSSAKSKITKELAEQVLFQIGGVKVVKDNYSWYEFDYNPDDIVKQIVCDGCVPEQKSHQYYPTPKYLAQRCIDMADIDVNHSVLEPSAGQGGIADYLPKDNLICIEVSELHCKILKEKGFNIINADFIKWAKAAPKFDRIVMNPPFSDGRAKLHVETAAMLLKHGGKIVAILPSGFKNKVFLQGFNHEYSDIISNEFTNTSISVVVLIAIKQ